MKKIKLDCKKEFRCNLGYVGKLPYIKILKNGKFKIHCSNACDEGDSKETCCYFCDNKECHEEYGPDGGYDEIKIEGFKVLMRILQIIKEHECIEKKKAIS